jgi:uncharacterized protein YndB with AHSA1/START domain
VEVPDSIEREVILPVPPVRVWVALTQYDQLSAWFGAQATVDLRPGGEIVFTRDGSTGPRGVVELVDPPHRFVFRWQSNHGGVPMTRVEFTLDPHPEGTHLRVVESGFASLPTELRRESHERNTRGWEHELGELAQYLARP